MPDYDKLKSGSDIRGTASEGVTGQEIDLTDEAVSNITCAFVSYLSKRLSKSAEKLVVSVGNDSRLSAPRLNACVCNALTCRGVGVYNCGLISTPAMFMTTLSENLDCDAAIMITASHHPFNKNGLKFFTKQGGLEGADISQILKLAGAGVCPPKAKGSIKHINFIDTYSKILTGKIKSATGEDKPLAGFKIIVDAGNGAGGFFAEKVLKVLGADTNGSQFLEPDGRFPNHIPNPENEEAMQSVCNAVSKNKADLGIIFDTDVDRAGAVSSDGKEINRNNLIALISAILLEERAGAYIVTDSITSDGLAEFIKEKGGHHHRYKRGYKNVINEAIRLNNEGKYSPLAIETSGHAALMENYFLDDGAYLMTRLLIKMAQLKKQGKKLFDMIKDLKSAKEGAEIRMGFNTADFKEYGSAVLDALKKFAATEKGWHPAAENHEGIRVSFDKNDGDGWFLLRLSLHDPIMPLNIESNTEGGTKIIAKRLYGFLKDYDKLELFNLKKFAGIEN